ncbi:MAG TPA: hypothetical protein VNI77_02805 [Nitrososphaera sp.]|nr:hypothetical protein [Nitrososphaera sp.]
MGTIIEDGRTLYFVNGSLGIFVDNPQDDEYIVYGENARLAMLQHQIQQEIDSGRIPLGGGGIARVGRSGGRSLWQRIKRLFGRSPSVPTLTGASGREMAREAVQYVKSFPGTAEQKAELFEQLAKQISEKRRGAWQAARMRGTDGSHVFSGQQGELLVIKLNGQVLRGRMQDGGVGFGQGGTVTPNYSNLRQLE